MRGRIEDVRAEVRRVFDNLGPGGGYIMAPTNHLQVDVPPDNVIELYRYAHPYGQYRPQNEHGRRASANYQSLRRSSGE